MPTVSCSSAKYNLIYLRSIKQRNSIHRYYLECSNLLVDAEASVAKWQKSLKLTGKIPSRVKSCPGYEQCLLIWGVTLLLTDTAPCFLVLSWAPYNYLSANIWLLNLLKPDWKYQCQILIKISAQITLWPLYLLKLYIIFILGRKVVYILHFRPICSPRSAIDPHSWNNIKHEGSLPILFVQIITI